MTPGRILYLLYHLPLAEMRRTVRDGGPWSRWLDHRGRVEMQKAAAHLTAPDFEAGTAVELHQLTGLRYLSQSIFCLWSFAQVSRRKIAPIFYDDGSLTPAAIRTLDAIFPHARFVRHAESLARVEALLPARRFPALHERFHRYPLIRKLINVHLGASGWKLVLDADLLFFRRPELLLAWLGDPTRPLHMMDVADAYGYSPSLLQKLAGRAVPPRVNVGLCGLSSETIDWEKLEWWCAQLLRAEGSHYLLEQALTALLFSGQDCLIAPPRDYVTLPARDEALSPRAVMHHYVANSKRWYFRTAWKKALALATRIIL